MESKSLLSRYYEWVMPVEEFHLRWAAIVSMQIAMMIFSSWFLAYDGATGGFSTIGVLAIPLVVFGFPLTGIAGLIQATRKQIKELYPVLTGILLFTSLAMCSIIVPLMLTTKIANLFSPTAEILGDTFGRI